MLALLNILITHTCMLEILTLLRNMKSLADRDIDSDKSFDFIFQASLAKTVCSQDWRLV